MADEVTASAVPGSGRPGLLRTGAAPERPPEPDVVEDKAQGWRLGPPIDTSADRDLLAAGPPSAATYDAGSWALDVLAAAGMNDSPAADAIRDAMDRHWPAKLGAERTPPGSPTPEERDGGLWLGGYDIRPLIDYAKAEEREACAKVADEYAVELDRAGAQDERWAVKVAAERIRSRG